MEIERLASSDRYRMYFDTSGDEETTEARVALNAIGALWEHKTRTTNPIAQKGKVNRLFQIGIGHLRSELADRAYSVVCEVSADRRQAEWLRDAFVYYAEQHAEPYSLNELISSQMSSELAQEITICLNTRS